MGRQIHPAVPASSEIDEQAERLIDGTPLVRGELAEPPADSAGQGDPDLIASWVRDVVLATPRLQSRQDGASLDRTAQPVAGRGERHELARNAGVEPCQEYGRGAVQEGETADRLPGAGVVPDDPLRLARPADDVQPGPEIGEVAPAPGRLGT